MIQEKKHHPAQREANRSRAVFISLSAFTMISILLSIVIIGMDMSIAPLFIFSGFFYIPFMSLPIFFTWKKWNTLQRKIDQEHWEIEKKSQLALEEKKNQENEKIQQIIDEHGWNRI